MSRSTNSAPPLSSLEDARERALALCSPCLPIEQVALDAALDRVLASEMDSPIPLPPFDNSAMDGYAFRHADAALAAGPGLRMVTTSQAGRPSEHAIAEGECARILTGAAMVEGADTVIPQEHVTLEGDRLRFDATPDLGAHIRRAGEDAAEGTRVLEAGTRLSAARIGLAANLGLVTLPVYRRPRVGFFSTGDELRARGEALDPGQIYDSNRPQLRALLESQDLRAVDLGRVPDRRPAVREALEASGDLDALISTGGVSVGDTDYVTLELRERGALELWRVAMKPGKPIAIARLGDCAFFGLPGNPVSALVTFAQIVRPALRRLAGERDVEPPSFEAICGSEIRRHPGRREFLRGRMESGPDGSRVVQPLRGQGSHQLAAMAGADCFIVIPEDVARLRAGDRVEVQPLTAAL